MMFQEFNNDYMKTSFFSILLVLLAHFSGFSQNSTATVTVSGTITDNRGNALANVSIQIQEKTDLSYTDEKGQFLISCSSNDVLIFKKEGYLSVSRNAVDLNGGIIQLTEALPDAGDDDDVYIPFGVRKKRSLTASVSSVKTDELLQIPLSTLNNTLAGRIPGLYVQQTGTRPGTDDATFLIRTRSSYNSGQEPLTLVDGVVRDFVNLDLGEIESISVLKDAGTLAWYGMNGANGVIYVTTKRGSPTKTRITLDMQGGVQMPDFSRMTQTLDAYDYAVQYNQVLYNDGNAPRYNQDALDAFKGGADPYNYPNVNYTDRFLKKSAPVQRYVATISGGNAFVKYFSLVSFYNQSGIYDGAKNEHYDANTGYNRYNFRTNLDFHINKYLDVRLDVGGRMEKLRYPFAGNGGFLTALYNTPANAFPIYNEDGSYGGTSLFRNNPQAMLNNDGNITDLYRMLLATLDARYKLDMITPGLSANVFYTYDITGMYQSGYNESYEIYEKNSGGGYTRFGNVAPLTYRNTTFNSSLRNNEFWFGFDYDRMFGRHDIKFSTRMQSAVSAAPGRLDNTRLNFANRLSYNFMQRYFADLILAYAGSQNFAPGKRFGFFPALSAGWIISDENFLQSATFINYLKIRGSVGVVGNDVISARRFAFNNYFNTGGSQYFFGTGYSAASNATELTLANPDLTWEKAMKASVGFEAKLFNQSLSLSADYFHERRSDLLTSALLPHVIGQEVVEENGGLAQYNGFETGISYNKQIGKTQIGLFLNYTHAQSKILSLNEEAGLPDYQRRQGHVIGSVGPNNIRTFLIADGIFQSQAEIDAAPEQRFSGVVKPGDIRYRDINGDGVIDNLDFVMTDYSDIPTSYYGFGFNISRQGVYLNVLFQGVRGRTISIKESINTGTAANGYITQFSKDSWTDENSAHALWPRMTINNRGNNTENSTFWLRSGDYLRLKAVELGYHLPDKLISKWGLNGCKFYVMGFNLLSFDQLGDLPIDAEIPLAGYVNNYPYIRTFAAGISLNF